MSRYWTKFLSFLNRAAGKARIPPSPEGRAGKGQVLFLLGGMAGRVQWKELVLAFAMAVTLWFGISGTENVESQVDVRLEYKGIPKDLLIRGPALINRVSVRVSGPTGQVRAMSGRDYVFTMDLSSLEPGDNALPIAIGRTGLFGGLKVIEVIPPEIRLRADVALSKEVPLRPDIRGTLPEGLEAEALLIPEKVVLRGPPQEVEKTQEIVVPLALGRVTEPGARDLHAPLPLPAGMETEPASVDAVVRVDWKRREVLVSRAVQAQPPVSSAFSLRPAKVRIRAALPEALASAAADNEEIRAVVLLSQFIPGDYILPVQVSLPAGGLLLQVEPAEISVVVKRTEGE
jgi:YbbR domain-containing protein